MSGVPLIDITTGTLDSIPNQVYTGNPIMPAITLTVNGRMLTEVTYSLMHYMQVPTPLHVAQLFRERVCHSMHEKKGGCPLFLTPRGSYYGYT